MLNTISKVLSQERWRYFFGLQMFNLTERKSLQWSELKCSPHSSSNANILEKKSNQSWRLPGVFFKCIIMYQQVWSAWLFLPVLTRAVTHHWPPRAFCLSSNRITLVWTKAECKKGWQSYVSSVWFISPSRYCQILLSDAHTLHSTVNFVFFFFFKWRMKNCDSSVRIDIGDGGNY